MQTKKRYNIGLVVGNIEDIFPNQICKGAMEAAEKLDVNLFIFPAKYLNRSIQDRNDPKQRYEYQYNLLLAYARSQSLDGVLLCLSNIGYRSSKARRQKVLDHFGNMPLILVASDEPGYVCTKFDNTAGLSDGINYLIKKKGCTHIGMVNGIVENSDALERFGVYKDTLTENGIEYNENLVGYGDLSNKCADAVNALLDKNPDMDALVCGNDTMAQAAYKVLKERNIAIGKDFFVLGFDDIYEAQFMDPPLATVRADATKLGYDSLVHLKELLDQDFFVMSNCTPANKANNDKYTFTVDTSFILRESAGAIFDNRDDVYDSMSRRSYKAKIDKRLRQMIDMNHMMNIANRDMLMFGDSNEQNYVRFLEAFALDIVTDAYLLLFSNPLVHHFGDDWITPHHLYLRAYSRNRQINDRFGHDDGDFAITSCANVLEKSLGKDGIVGRIGGDEFAAFYKLIDCECPDDIRSRIKSICARSIIFPANHMN